MTTEELTEKVESALEEIRPYLLTDGGNISLVDIVDDVVQVRLEGACVSCSVSHMTMTNGVAATIRRNVPQIKKVVEISQEQTN